MRWLGSAQGVRALLVAKTPPPAVDALLLTALALLWPAAQSPYADHTLVDQAVAAATRLHKASGGFINAVLRRFLREREAWVTRALADPVARYNHPTWWIDRLRHDWPGHWEALLDADNQHPPMTLRVNARRGDALGYQSRLAEQGIGARATGPHTLVLDRPCAVTQLPGFSDGEVSVQDASAQRAAPLLLGDGLPAGARVLDACAAPGGKTAHLLELADLEMWALDLDPQRLERVRETLDRLQLSARALAADAAEPQAWWDGQAFDAILLDAPCSAAGIVRRHPDVRWLRRGSDIETLTRTQARLLDALWPLLRRGGRLLYCTCSVFRIEGQEQVDAFLQRRPDAKLTKHPPSPGHLLPLADNRSGAGLHEFGAVADGFFYALIEKT
jgi:16S rRNA (cytosine967-C5)-methyltransferase